MFSKAANTAWLTRVSANALDLARLQWLDRRQAEAIELAQGDLVHHASGVQPGCRLVDGFKNR